MIGKYQVLKRIGSGSLGAIYEAYDPFIRRTVAIKTCESPDPATRVLFFREASLAGGLRHRNIAVVLDSGLDGEVPYLVYELLPGENLDEIIRRGALLSTEEKVGILIGIAYGLEHAHKQGIVHGDVQPANVRVLKDRTVKIMNFGATRPWDTSADTPADPTKTGAAPGPSSNPASHKIRGEPSDSGADIFSFGALAHELIGHEETVREEALSEASPDVVQRLVGVIETARARDPSDRYKSMEDVRKDLMAIRASLLAASRPRRPEVLSIAEEERDRSSLPEAPAISPTEPVYDTSELPILPLEAESPPRRKRGLSAIGLAVPLSLLAAAGLLLWLIHVLPTHSAENARQTGSTSGPAPSGTARSIRSEDQQTSPPAHSASKPQTATEFQGDKPPIAVRERHRRLELADKPAPVPQPAARESWHARAAGEPGLSRETRAALYLQSASSSLAAGNPYEARQWLRAALAIRPDLEIRDAIYGPDFARLAREVRSDLPR